MTDYYFSFYHFLIDCFESKNIKFFKHDITNSINHHKNPQNRQFDTNKLIIRMVYQAGRVYITIHALFNFLYLLKYKRINLLNFTTSSLTKLLAAYIGFFNHKYNHYPKMRESEIPKYITILQKLHLLNNKEYHDLHHKSFHSGKHFSFITGYLGSDIFSEYLYYKFKDSKYRIYIPISVILSLGMLDVCVYNNL